MAALSLLIVVSLPNALSQNTKAYSDDQIILRYAGTQNAKQERPNCVYMCRLPGNDTEVELGRFSQNMSLQQFMTERSREWTNMDNFQMMDYKSIDVANGKIPAFSRVVSYHKPGSQAAFYNRLVCFGKSPRFYTIELNCPAVNYTDANKAFEGILRSISPKSAISSAHTR
jgi:hypothetical protein